MGRGRASSSRQGGGKVRHFGRRAVCERREAQSHRPNRAGSAWVKTRRPRRLRVSLGPSRSGRSRSPRPCGRPRPCRRGRRHSPRHDRERHPRAARPAAVVALALARGDRAGRRLDARRARGDAGRLARRRAGAARHAGAHGRAGRLGGLALRRRRGGRRAGVRPPGRPPRPQAAVPADAAGLHGRHRRHRLLAPASPASRSAASSPASASAASTRPSTRPSTS